MMVFWICCSDFIPFKEQSVAPSRQCQDYLQSNMWLNVCPQHQNKKSFWAKHHHTHKHTHTHTLIRFVGSLLRKCHCLQPKTTQHYVAAWSMIWKNIPKIDLDCSMGCTYTMKLVSILDAVIEIDCKARMSKKNNLCVIETLIANHHKAFDNTINVIGALVFSGLVAYNQGSMEPSLETNFDKNILAQKFDPPRYWLETSLRLESFEQVELVQFLVYSM